MPDTKISDFSAAAALGGSELVAGVQSAANVKITIDQIKTYLNIPATYIFVDNVSDLPTPVADVITLLDNYTYFFTATVDLAGDRLVAGQGTTILGTSSENSRIKSTGLGATALLSGVYTLSMRNITLEADIALNMNATNSAQNIEWSGVRFIDCATIGTIANHGNVILSECIASNSAELTFDGTIGTIVLHSCVLDGRATKTTIILPATLTISNRFRVVYSSFNVLTGETGISVSGSATIPVESYILDGVVFSGGSATYTSGVAYSDNKAAFINCTNIPTSSHIGHLYWTGNATATTIAVSGTMVKAAGTSTAGALIEKFTHSTGRLTYAGGFTGAFYIDASVTLTSGNTHDIGIVIAKNGTPIANSESRVTTSGTGRVENVSNHTVIQLAPTDYVELWVTNYTTTTDVLIIDLSLLVSVT
jgi:hypothetical protein